jgi:hypothetical protein
VAETNGLLNRRTGKSGTEGSNPSVSATHSIISKTCVESVGLPTFLPTFEHGLATADLAPNSTPPPSKTYPARPHRSGTPQFWLMGPTVPSYILLCASVSWA